MTESVKPQPGHVGGSGTQATHKMDGGREVLLFKAEHGGYIITGRTEGVGEARIGLSDEAMQAVVTLWLYLNGKDGIEVEWTSDA